MNDAVKPKTWKVVLCTKGEIQLPREIAEHAGGYISFDPTVSIGVGVLNSNRPMRWLRLHLVLRYVQSETGKAIRSRRRFYIAGPLLLLPNGGITANDLSGLDLKDRTLEVRQQMVTGLDGGPEFVIDLLPLYTKVQAMRRIALEAVGAKLTEQFNNHSNASVRPRSFTWPWARKGDACRTS